MKTQQSMCMFDEDKPPQIFFNETTSAVDWHKQLMAAARSSFVWQDRPAKISADLGELQV